MCTAFQRVLTQKSRREKDQSLDSSDISDQTQKPRNQSGGKWKLRKRKQLHLLGILYFCYGKIFWFRKKDITSFWKFLGRSERSELHFISKLISKIVFSYSLNFRAKMEYNLLYSCFWLENLKLSHFNLNFRTKNNLATK